MELDWTFFALAIPATMFAGVSKGGFGSGADFAAIALLALILEPGQAIGLLMPLLMIMDAAALKPYWKAWDPPSAKVLILGGLPGVILGAALFRVADPDVFRFLIGVIAIGFVAFQIARARGLIRRGRAMPDRFGLLAGAGAGFTSCVAHAGAPLAAVYLLSKPLDRRTYQATTVIVFWVINLFKAVAYVAVGIFTPAMIIADIYLIPFAILGVWLGVRAHHAVPERLFFSLIHVFLILAGAKLIWDALV